MFGNRAYNRTKETFPLMESLAVAVAVDRQQGFLKSKQGYVDPATDRRVADNRTTILHTLRVMNGKASDDDSQPVEQRITPIMPTDEDRAGAKEIFDHFDEILVMDKLADDLVKQGKDGRVNDFNLQLSQVFAKDEVDVNKELAMIASLPNSRRKSAVRERMDDFHRDNKMNGFIGTVKDRIKITGEVMDVKFIPRHSIHLATVFTADKKIAKFFMNDKQSDVAKRINGETITFVGTVKKQEVNDFTGCQETMFNRVKID